MEMFNAYLTLTNIQTLMAAILRRTDLSIKDNPNGSSDILPKLQNLQRPIDTQFLLEI